MPAVEPLAWRWILEEDGDAVVEGFAKCGPVALVQGGQEGVEEGTRRSGLDAGGLCRCGAGQANRKGEHHECRGSHAGFIEGGCRLNSPFTCGEE